MAKDDKCTVMVSVLEGRFFPKKPSYRVFIQCAFNKVVLAVDPVCQSTTPVWDTELAWDLEARALHFLRSQRATIKLMCYSLSPQDKKELLGYIVLDIRSTDNFPAREKWMPLINNKLSSKTRPEIKLAFGAGPQLIESDPPLPPPSLTTNHSISTPYLEPSMHSSPKLDPHPMKHTISSSPENFSKSLNTPSKQPVAFSPPRHLKTPPQPITSEPSPLKDFPSLQLLEDGTYLLGDNPSVLYHLDITIFEVKDLHFLSVIPPPTQPSSGFYIFLQLFQHQLKTIPFPNYKSPSFPEEKLKLKIKSNPQDMQAFFSLLNGFKIYLGFDEALLAECTFQLPSLLENLGKEKNWTLSLHEPAIQIHDHPKVEIKSLLKALPLSKPSSPTSIIKPMHRTLNETDTSKVGSSNTPSTIVWHQYRFSIDIKAIRDLALHSSNVFVKYSYPAFGTPSPFISHPPIQVFKNMEASFHQAFAAYEFVMSPLRLQQYFEGVPLELQLFHKDNFTKDQFLGSAQVSFTSLLQQPKKQIPGANEKIQVLDQWVHIFTDETMKERVATLRVALSLEDFGLVEEQVGFEPGGLHGNLLTTQVIPQVPPPPLELSAQEKSTSLPLSSETGLNPVASEPKISNAIPSPPSQVPSSSSAPSHSVSLLSHSHSSLEAFWQQAQLQVDTWKKKQEVLFSQELEKRDQLAMEELEKKMLQKESALDARMQEFRILEQQLEKLLADLETREAKLAEAEQAAEDRQVEMERAFQTKCMQVDDLATKLATEYQQKHQLESQLTQELQRQKSDLIQERNEWEAKYRHLDAQFFEFKNKHTVPETEYQKKIVDLTEKVAATEKKMGVYKAQKGHFKAQWLKTLAEYGHFKKSVESTMQQSLLQKQQEIESQQETLKQIQHELHEIKSTQDQFKKSVLEAKSNPAPKSPEKPPLQALPPPPPAPAIIPPIFDFKSQIQRLTEERELLLKSGVYRPSDPLIRDITSKIEEFSKEAAR